MSIDSNGIEHIRALDYCGTHNSPGSVRSNGGRTVSLSPGESKTILHVQGTENESSVMTVTLGICRSNETNDDDPEDPIVIYSLPPCKAIIQWGSDGASQECEIDVKNGTMFSVPAASCRVTVVNEVVLESVESSFYSPKAVVSASIGYYPRPGGDCPTRTLGFVDVEDEVDSYSYCIIPPLARAVTVRRRTSSTNNFFFGRFEGSNIPASLLYGGQVANGSLAIKAEIPNDATIVMFTASDLGAIAIFDIAL